MFHSPKVPSVTAEDVKNALNENDSMVILDVRTPNEYERGHIEGSINLPIDTLQMKAESVLPDKNQRIYVYCLSGSRSMMAVKDLTDLEYTNVYDMKSGLLAWRAKGYLTVMVGNG